MLRGANAALEEPCGGASTFQLPYSGLHPKRVYRNLPTAALYELALAHEPGTIITSTGALATMSGAKTGRSPKDKRVVKELSTEKDVWWRAEDGNTSPNYEMDERSFLVNRETAMCFLNARPHVFVTDGFANWDLNSRIRVRVVTARAYHALFMSNMLIRPTPAELDDFGEPDFVIFNSGAFPANRYGAFMTSSTSVAISLKHREMVILGTEYAGEMKKGVFSYMHYLMPKRGILTLHSGCNVGAHGDVTLFFGLSGTGKTTLSTEPHRPLIGDDEHCWGDEGVFNIEGGCYAKCIGLQANSEPEIFRAIRFGTVLENVVVKPETRQVHYASAALTENTRASYPISYIDNARVPCMGPHPRNVVLLCCDAFGVLPPVSKLTLEQAMYHFISGYTSKVAGTEMGITEPEATFSACYGGAFLVWHPMKYASMLAERMQKHGTRAWLVNTGWTGGSYGVGRRMSLKHTREIIDAIHSGELEAAPTEPLPLFGLAVPTQCHGLPQDELLPHEAWGDDDAYYGTLTHLARLFVDAFKQYLHDADEHVGSEMAQRILSGGPDMAALEAAEARYAQLERPPLTPKAKVRTAKAAAAAPAAASPVAAAAVGGAAGLGRQRSQVAE